MAGLQYPSPGGAAGSTGTAGDRHAAWHAVTGSVRGAAHQLRGLPNQDAAACLEVPGGGLVVAIADGHGHARHFRSAEGSALAVGVACREAARLVAAAPELPTVAAVRAAARDLTLVVVAQWRAAVAAQLAAAPYTAQEQAVLDAAGDDPEVPYGSTLLVAVIAGPWLVCAQIGDGDMLGVRPDGGLLTPVPGDDRLGGHQTTSLCQPDAEESFRADAHDLRETPLAALLAATDGYGNAQAEEPWQPGVGRDLAELAAGRDAAWFEQQVPEWARLCASSEGSGDDTTIALLLAPAGSADGGRARGGAADGDGEAAPWTV